MLRKEKVMKKLLTLLLLFSILITPCLTVLADDSVYETAPASSKTDSGASRNTIFQKI